MADDAISSSFLASFHTWLTPTVLFVLLNVVIGTIAVTSKSSRRQNPPSPPNHRSSFNLPTSNPLDDPPPPLPHSHASGPNEPDPTTEDLAAGEVGEKPDFAHFEEAEILKQADDGIVAGEEGREVDARADDFINRFRAQLKLQRNDSVIRHKAMIDRGH